MADGLIFFMYIIAGSMGLVGVLQILLLFRYGNTGNRALFTPMRRFMLCTVAMDFLYLGYDYYRLKQGEHTL